MNDLQVKAKEKSGLSTAGEPVDESATDSVADSVGDSVADSREPEAIGKSSPSAQNTHKPISAVEKAVYVAMFIGLVAIRIPSILGQGRFWAEEGNIFFSNAWHMHWNQAMLVSYGGYLNITANLAGVLAKHLAPLEKACYVTSIFGLIIQTIPPVILCLSRDQWLQNKKTLAAAMLIIATLPLSQEVWLSSIGSQCHLNLCAALILVSGTGKGFNRIFQYLVLFLGPLSGPGAAFLVPLYLLRAWIQRSRDRLFQGIILGCAAMIQFLFFWHPQERVLGIDPALLMDVFFLKHLVAPFLGMQESMDLTNPWRQLYLDGHIPSVEGIAGTAVIMALFAVAAWRSKSPEPKWFLISGLLMATLSNFGALGDRSSLLTLGANERYVFAPQVLFELSLLYMACASAGWTRVVCRALISWLLVIAVHEYFWTPGYYKDGPSWRSEVAHWRADHSYKPQIWPIGNWRVDLNK